MDCHDVHRFVHAFVDGEFDEEERVDFAAHLAGCERCRRIVRFENGFRQQLRARMAPVPTPAAVRQRLMGALDGCDRRQRWQWGWRLLPASVGVAAMAMGVVYWQRSSTQAALADFAEATIFSHRQQLPLDVRGSDTEPIRRYFAGKVPFAIRPPRLAADARLVGARLSHLRQHQAAYLSYQVNGERVSVFIIDSQAMPSVEGTRVGRRLVSWRDAHGYPVVFFRAGGTGYAVAGDMDRNRLVKLISSP